MSSEQVFLQIMSYIPLGIFTVGVIGNLSAFAILNFNRELNKLSSMRILAYVALIDIFCISVWNLNHFFQPNYGYRIEYLNLPLCRILTFVQYFSLHSSSLLFGFMSIDRYFTVISVPGSFVSKLPFGTPKCATRWSASIVGALLLLNIHLLIYPGRFTTVTSVNNNNNKTTNETVTIKFDCDMTYGYILPEWNKLANLLLGNFIPFFIMLVFNSLLIRKTFMIHYGSKMNAMTQRRHLTISLLIISFCYIIFTLPSSVLFGFLYRELASSEIGMGILIFFDNLLFTQHALLFFECYLVNSKFRQIVNQYCVSCLKCVIKDGKLCDKTRKL